MFSFQVVLSKTTRVAKTLGMSILLRKSVCHASLSFIDPFNNPIIKLMCYVLKAKFQCHPARCLLPVEIMQRCGLATGPATVELLPYLLPY